MAINKKFHEDFQKVQQDFDVLCANPNPANLKNLQQDITQLQNDISNMAL